MENCLEKHKRIEEDLENHGKRIKDLEDWKTQQLVKDAETKGSIDLIKQTTQATAETVNKLSDTINEKFYKEPIQNIGKLKWLVISTLVTLVITSVAGVFIALIKK